MIEEGHIQLGLSPGGHDTAAPWVDVSWPAVAGIEAYVLYRKNLGTDTVEELTRQPGTSYRDSAVAFGDAFAYSIATVLGTRFRCLVRRLR